MVSEPRIERARRAFQNNLPAKQCIGMARTGTIQIGFTYENSDGYIEGKNHPQIKRK